jgi:hypothetical protein
MKKIILLLILAAFSINKLQASALSQFQIESNYLVSNKLNVPNSTNTTFFKVDISITRMLYSTGYEGVDWTVTIMYSPSGNTGATDNVAISIPKQITEADFTTGSPGVFSTTIDATLPANKTTGSVFLKYVYYLYDGTGYKNPNPSTLYSATYGISATTPVTIYYSAARSVPFTKACTPPSVGSVVNYVLSYGKYTSKVNQSTADGLATQDISANGQNYANANGNCYIPLGNNNIVLQGQPGYLDTKTINGNAVTGGTGTISYTWEINQNEPVSPGVWAANTWGALLTSANIPYTIADNSVIIPNTTLKFANTVYIRRTVTSGAETLSSNVIQLLKPVSTNPALVINVVSATRDVNGKFSLNTSASFSLQNPASGVTYDWHYLSFSAPNVPLKVAYVTSGNTCQVQVGPYSGARPDFLYIYGSDGSFTTFSIFKTN